jgi:prophage regulatory protein
MKVLSYEDLKLLKGIDYSRIQLWRREKQGSFPRRIFLSPQRFGWPEHEIDQWIADRIAERDSKAAAAAGSSFQSPAQLSGQPPAFEKGRV